MTIKKIAAFDFDDTLATTESQIAVQRLGDDGAPDPLFEDWLLDHNIQYNDVINGFYWLDSANFALYEEFASGFDDVIDYAGTATFNLATAQAIDPMLRRLAQAEADPNTLALIITARGGRKEIYSPSQGATIKPQNRQQILRWLKTNGVNLGASRLHTVGDMGDDSAAHKVVVLVRYLEKYKPEELVFYDDNENNVRAVAELCKRFAPSVRISAYRVANGTVSSPSGCNEVVNLRRKKIFSPTGRYR